MVQVHLHKALMVRMGGVSWLREAFMAECGRVLGDLNLRGGTIDRTQKGTMTLTTYHPDNFSEFWVKRWG